jgi:flagellar motility protein MotE (MotC chaperone)
MADEEKDEQAVAEEESAKKKDKTGDEEEGEKARKSGVSPLILIISAVGSLVVFVGVFSYMMGVFDQKPPEVAEKSAAEPVAEEAAYPEAHGFQTDFGRAAAEADVVLDSGVIDTFAELSLLDQRRQDLQAEEARISEERRELLSLRQEVEHLLSRQDAIADEKVLYMAKLLDGMKPDEMAGLVSELDNKMILMILPKMKTQNASKLLTQLPAKRAAAITTALLESES